jgi:hypothetical protein
MSVRSRGHPRGMLLATVICSDPDCTEEVEVSVGVLDELDGLVCECGYGFVLLSVAAEPIAA